MSPETLSTYEVKSLQSLRGTRALEYLERQYADTKEMMIDAKDAWMLSRLQGRASVYRDLLSIINDEG